MTFNKKPCKVNQTSKNFKPDVFLFDNQLLHYNRFGFDRRKDIHKNLEGAV